MNSQQNRQESTDEVLRFFVDKFSGEIGSTFLVKLAYLGDYESHRHLGRGISGLDYAVDNHGPFDPAFYASVDRLKASGVIRAEPTDFGFDRPGLTYFSSKTLPYRFSSAEWAILTYVADRFAGKNLRHILEVAYETEPFKVARPDGKGVSLPMSLVDNQGTDANGGISIGDVLEGKQAISEGDWTDLGDWERGIQGTA